MKEKIDIRKPIYSFLPTDIEGLDSLAELALDMRWSWNHAADEVWQQLETGLWNLTLLGAHTYERIDAKGTFTPNGRKDDDENK